MKHRKMFFATCTVVAVALCTSISAQDNGSYAHSYIDLKSKNEFHYVGMQLDVGTPAGAALGVSVHPATNVVRLGIAGTFNRFAPGLRGSATFDPIGFIVAPTLTLQYGGSFAGKVPNTAVSVSYTYFDILPGIEFGSMTAFRFFIRSGVSWADFNISGLNSFIDKSYTNNKGGDAVVNNIVIHTGDPKTRAQLMPALQLGFNAFFF